MQGLRVGLAGDALSTVATQGYRVVQDLRTDKQADGVVTLGPRSGAGERRVYATLTGGQVDSLVFTTADPPGRASALFRVLPLAVGLTFWAAMAWFGRATLRRAWNAHGGAEPQGSWSPGQVLHHVIGLPLSLGGLAMGAHAWRLGQLPGGCEQKLSMLFGSGAFTSAVPSRWINRS